MCIRPAGFDSYFNKPMSSKSYNCPSSEMPFDYENWNPKWYSPVCRDWYQDAEKAGNRGIISDPYMMAQRDGNEIGITACMPIQEQPDLDQEPEFFGAICTDNFLTDDIKFFN